MFPKGGQAWYCYGKRTNKVLLENYGFCFKDNLYDSVKCFLKLDIPYTLGKLPSLSEMLSNDTVGKTLQEIRFKRYHLNQVLMAYIRSSYLESWSAMNPIDKTGQKSRFSIGRVTNLEFEDKCLKRYKEIVLSVKDKLEKETTL